jgi:hypothetical protein
MQEEPAEPKEPAEVTIALQGLPDDARVTFDGRDVDPPVTLPRSDDSVVVAVRADGYEDYEATVLPDQDREISVDMKPLPPAAPVPAVAAGTKAGASGGGAGGAPGAGAAPQAEKSEEETKPKKKKNVWATNPF